MDKFELIKLLENHEVFQVNKKNLCKMLSKIKIENKYFSEVGILQFENIISKVIDDDKIDIKLKKSIACDLEKEFCFNFNEINGTLHFAL